MNKKIKSILLASSLIASFQIPNSVFAQEMPKCTDIDSLTDVVYKHWAYDSVKFVTQEFCIMTPRTPSEFKGAENATRNDVANSFYNSAKKLESISGKNLKVVEGGNQVIMPDLDSENKFVVNSIVNEYGIMQAMPGNKFLGNDKISRYELAFELNNYLKLLGEKMGKNTLEPIDKISDLNDIKEDHWATPSVKQITNKYQLMLGYPDNTFRGYQTLTRFELAVVLKKFFSYVDKYYIPLPTPTPTPEPVFVPVPVPTPEPTPEPTPTPSERPPLPTVDLRVGGNYHVANVTNTAGSAYGSLYGPSAAVNIWFGEFKNFGIGLNGDYTIYDSSFSVTPTGLQRITYAGDLNWRAIGNYADDFQFVLGVGYQGWQLTGNNYTYMNHGPKAKASIEIPIGSMFSIFAEDSFTYYLGQSQSFVNNYEYTNDLYTGITIPAYSFFSVQIGYKDIRYKLAGKDLRGDVGGLANLRFRF